MSYKKHFSVTMAMLVLLCFGRAQADAQSETAKWEAGVQFTALHHSGSAFPVESQGQVFNIPGSPGITDYGFGGRLAFNVTRHVSLEGELNFFPRELITSQSRTQGLFGVKVGKRFSRIGIFGKARPGFVHYSENKPITPLMAIPGKTLFALDLGGAIEINHSRRVFTRFDFGDTMIRTNVFMPVDGSNLSRVRHDFQFSVGIGFRFP